MSPLTLFLIIKSLDIIHDLLCPFFRNEDKKINEDDLKKINEKLDRIEKLLKK